MHILAVIFLLGLLQYTVYFHTLFILKKWNLKSMTFPLTHMRPGSARPALRVE